MKISMVSNVHSTQADLISTGLQEMGHSISRKFKKSKTEVFHYLWDPSGIDDPRLFHEMKKHVGNCIVHYMNDQIVPEKLAHMFNPYFSFVTGHKCMKSEITNHARFFRACIVSNFDLARAVSPFFNRIYILPLAFVPTAPSRQTKRNVIPCIIHVKQQNTSEQSVFIQDCLNQLKEAGMNFDYSEIDEDNVYKHPNIIDRADLLIDQILKGWYSPWAVDAMGAGKAVISYIREDLIARYNVNIPVVSANPATLCTRLRTILEEPDSLSLIGDKSKRYVNRFHSLKMVSRQLQWIYEREKFLHRKNLRCRPTVVHMNGSKRLMYAINMKTFEVMANSKRRLLSPKEGVGSIEEN